MINPFDYFESIERKKDNAKEYASFLVNYAVPLKKKYGFPPTMKWCEGVFDLKHSGQINNNGVKELMNSFYEEIKSL